MVSVISNNSAFYTRQGHFDSERMAGTVAHWQNNGKGAEARNITEGDALSLKTEGTIGSPNTTAPSLSFGELLDIINPLQHIPVISKYYRQLTGDDISPVAQIVGGTIYGGALGGVASIANAAIQEHSGQNMTNAVMNGLSIQEKPEPTRMAQASNQYRDNYQFND